MKEMARLLGWLALMLPLLVLACMDPAEIQVREVRVAGGDAGVEEDAGEVEGVESGERRREGEDGEEELPGMIDDGGEELGFDEEYEVSERDQIAAREGSLEVDRSAPDLEILSVERQEGTEGHYLVIRCHDATPGLPTRWFNWQRRVSRDCDMELAAAVRGISFSPAVRFRIAPSSQGLRILGDFRQGEYELTLKAGLRTEAGAVLKEDEVRSISIPRRSPMVAFTAQGRYLPRTAWEDLTFRHRNVEEVQIEIRHVPPQNMAFWLSEPENPYRRHNGGNEGLNQRTSNRVAETTMALRSEEDQIGTSRLALRDLVPRPEQGLYQVRLESGGTTATIQVQVTDINLIVKRHEAAPGESWERAADVWAVDMESTRALSGVQVEMVRPSGERMARCETNRLGHCRLELPEEDVDDAAPMAIFGRRGQDMTYLRFRDVPTEIREGRIDGPAYVDDESYRGTLHGDRDLYRPGDVFHLVGALREGDYGAVGAGIPVELQVRDSRNQIVVEEIQETNEAGLVDLSFPLNEVAPTGRWRAEMLVGKRRVQSYSFHVEEFVPERLEVRGEAKKERVVGDEEIGFEVFARYLFGADAVGSEVELQCQATALEARESGGFQFGPLYFGERAPVIDLPMAEGRIGAENLLEIACPKIEEPLEGPAQIRAAVAVSEAGSGRATRTSAEAMYFPEPFQIGLQSEVESLRGGDTFGIRGVVLDLEGERAKDFDEEITLEFFNVRTQSSRQYDSMSGRYIWETNYQFLLERVVDVKARDGKFRVENTAADVGAAYLVRARVGQGRTDLRIDRRGHYWDWSAGGDRTPRALRPTNVGFQPPAQAELGAETEVRFRTPFGGRALLTVETNEVLHQEWIQAEAGENTWRFTLQEHLPNVYVTAFVIRDPRHASNDSFAPERAFGAVSIPVDRRPLEMPLEVDVVDEIRPGESLEVRLAAARRGQEGPIYATVAVVDEGILQLTNYRSPDPLETLLVRRGLGVQTFDTVGWATQLPPTGPSARTGGGDYWEEEPSGGRIMPFKPVAMFSGPVKLDEAGRGTVYFDVPNYRGRLRVMAVAFGPERMGSGDGDVLVRDPLTVDATFPRFLIAGDEVRIPVFLANLTDEDRLVDVEIEAEAYDLPGILRAQGEEGEEEVLIFEGASRAQVEVGAGESTTVYFAGRALSSGGAAAMKVRASSGELSSLDEGMIPFRAGGPMERKTYQVELGSGDHDLSWYLNGWERGSEESTLWISAMSQPQAFDHLEYLIRYPFGCAEQTISSARPLLFVSQLVEAVSPGSVAQSGGVDSMVEAGISRILSMQASNGAVAYWPGGSWYSTWVTAYALHFLIDAAELGYSVPAARMESAVEWLKSNIDESPDSAYGHYVLAIAGEAQLPRIRRAINGLSGSRNGQAEENAYLLYAALYLGGDRSFEEELKNPKVGEGTTDRSMGWTFYSDRRRRGMMLSIFVDLFGHNSEGEALAEAVIDDLAGDKRPRYYTTQEVLWAVTGLGKWLRRDAREIAEIELLVNGRPLAPAGHVYGQPRWSIARLSELGNVTLSVNRLDEEARLYAVLASEGVREMPSVRFGGEGLHVNQRLLDRNGQPLQGRSLSPGELVYMEVEIENRSGRSLSNVALVSRLPAGVEVENQDLGAAAMPNFARTNWDYDHSNGRDDRMEFFGGLNARQSRRVYFAGRATLSGEFHIPSLEAEAMYDPDIWARAKGGTLRIEAASGELVD